MAESAHRGNWWNLAYPSEGALANRLFRTMVVAVAIGVTVSAALAPWLVTTGLLLGGLLSLVNHHWMRTSIAAAFSPVPVGKRPRVHLLGYLLRYFVVGAVVFLAYSLTLVSLPATIAGLCSFVVALFAEALLQIYFAIVHREETN